jgi:hypothetical protein
MRIILIIDPAQGTLLRAALLALLALVAAPATGRAETDASAPGMAIEGRLDEPRSGSSVEHGKAFTGDATPVEPGHVEVEIAYAPTWWATAGAVDRQAGDQHQVVAAVGVGLVPDLDLRVAVGWAVLHATPASPDAASSGMGLADTTVAARWRFLSLADPAIDLAATVAVTAPTGTRSTAQSLGTSQETWSVGGAVLASADWGRVTAGAELGISVPVRPRNTNDVALVACNVAVGYQALPWLQPEAELNYQHEVETGAELDQRVLWATAALVLPLDSVRVLVGARMPVWTSNAAGGPMATAAVKFAF